MFDQFALSIVVFFHAKDAQDMLYLYLIFFHAHTGTSIINIFNLRIQHYYPLQMNTFSKEIDTKILLIHCKVSQQYIRTNNIMQYITFLFECL